MSLTTEVIAECQKMMAIIARCYWHYGIETDDLISCAWLRVCSHINQFDESRASFQTFVSRHAHYAMKDYLRALAPGTRPQKGLLRMVSLTHDPEHCDLMPGKDEEIAVTSQVDVNLLMRRLNEQEKRIIRMRFWEDRELKDIGKQYGFGQAWAWVRIREALGKMAAPA